MAFFGEYKLKDLPSPHVSQMLEAYQKTREAGLENVRLANIGLFVKSEEDYEILIRSEIAI